MERELISQPEPEITLRGSCGECRHSHFSIQGMFSNPHLMCRAHPPRTQLIPGEGIGNFQMTALYPIVDRNATCGEFEATRVSN